MTAATLPLQLLLLTVSGWVHRHQQDVIAYLVEENRVLKEQLGGRKLRLTDDQRRRRAAKARLLGRRALDAVATLVTPDTLMRWHRPLIAWKWTYVARRVGRRAALPPRTFSPQGPTLGTLIDAYLQDYHVRQFRSQSTARGRTAHLVAFFGRDARAATLTTYQIRQYQLTRRAAGAATGTINRETSALHRMCTLAVHWGWLDTVPGFPDRLRENPPRQGFFEHPEYLAVRTHLPAPWQDILDLAYYSGWRKNEILGLTWDEIDEAGGVIRLSPARSKTLVGRILPISPPIADALNRRRARRDPDSPLVFHRDGITIRRWRTAWRTACQAAGVPTRFLHDCRRTAARNLIRANVPERVAMLLTGHKSRAIFDRYNIIHEQELLDAGDQLVEYLAQQAQAVPARRRPHTAGAAAPRPASPLRLVRRGTA